MITIKKASNKAIAYACKYYHYAGHSPAGNVLGYSVFNDDEFCGVVTFGSGANNNIGTAYGLKQGEVCELTRVALNGKQPTTSQVVAMCLKRLKKDAPLIRLVVSYADVDQKHFWHDISSDKLAICRHELTERERRFLYHTRQASTRPQNIKLCTSKGRFARSYTLAICAKVL